MVTQKLTPNQNGINTACEILKNGGTVAIPTETVYGLAANAFDKTAIEKIFIAKGRPQDNPLIVHIANMQTLGEIAKDIPKTAYLCAEKFWPGPLTIVLKRTDKIPSCVSAGLDTVAVRMPSCQIARQVIEKSGLPLAAPSANLSGSPSPTTANHVICDLDGKIDAVLMGENCDVGVESTVITLATNPPVLLRPGGITLEQLREVLPDITVNKAVLAELEKGETAASPGMKYKHYAPKTKTFLVEGENFAQFVNQKQNAVAICFKEESNNITIEKIIYGSSKTPKTLAQNLFKALRDVDDLGAQEVYIHAPEKSGIGLAVYNRLIRAAAFKVIKL
ncbi:MAG: threonylcarbamoyl-AMP synthase [Ruminococcaceae bacterium]|nr:threonylcarbamoyl-AMP synthase [Oscillospiraceae bacterium]